jgi:ribonuclease III
MALDRSLEPNFQPDSLSLMARRPSLDLADLEHALGYSFKDRAHLEQALTHISALPGTPADGPHYQRLEFLGDRVLGVVIAEMLYETFSHENEGQLSRRLAALVRKESCATVAETWGAAPYIRLGTGEKLSGMRKKAALLGDVCEAILAAVFLDGGFEAARGVIKRSFGPHLTMATEARRDAKSALQEWAMAKGLSMPLYREIRRTGPDHAPVFVIAVELSGYDPAEAEGSSKKMAEHAAAQAFLKREEIEEMAS